MKNVVLHCFVSLMVYIQSVSDNVYAAFRLLVKLYESNHRMMRRYLGKSSPSSETVWLQDVSNELHTDKRILSDLDLSDTLTFTFSRGSQSINLNLKKNYAIDPNADIYVVQKSKYGKVEVIKSQNLEQEDLAYYQDVDNGAFMTVRCVRRSSGQCVRVINGNIQIAGRNYDLRPAETGVTLRNLLESNHLRGTKYFIEDQEQVKRRTAAWKGDSGNGNIINVEQKFLEHVRLSRRGQDKQNHFLRQDATMSSRNIADFQERGTEEEVRNLETEYYVDIGVLIDSGIWDLHSSLIQSSDEDEKERQVKRSIRQYFSHIINGVYMRYNGIKDDSISITVILSGFFIYKREDIFPHNMSEVLRHAGKTYIEVQDYLTDIQNWDIDFSDSLTTFDHAMLFTSHDLYEDQLSNNNVVGLSHTGGVCNIGERASVIELRDYFQTVNAAAHELGHSLGANHDGEKRSIACPAEDLYIMSRKMPIFEKSKPIPRNPWHFSNCSVDLFKSELSHKDCVKNIGKIYDDEEWLQNVGRLPGRVYTLRQQCQLIKGPNSDFCGRCMQGMCVPKGGVVPILANKHPMIV